MCLWLRGLSFLENPVLATEPRLAEQGARQQVQGETPFFSTQMVRRQLNNHLSARCDGCPGPRLRQVASDVLGINVANHVHRFAGRQEGSWGWESMGRHSGTQSRVCSSVGCPGKPGCLGQFLRWLVPHSDSLQLQDDPGVAVEGEMGPVKRC